MTVDDAQFGLRERKRLATRQSIQLAALSLVSEHGLEKLTVDEISRRADVSPRTFFNYFASKEDALIGEAPELPDEAAIERFVHAPAGSCLFDDLGALLASTVDNSGHGDTELVLLRRALLKQYPELFALRMTAMRNFEQQLGEVVQRRLAIEEPELAKNPAALGSRARLVTLVAFSAIRHAWSCWADAKDSGQLTDRITESFRELRHILATAQAA